MNCVTISTSRLAYRSMIVTAFVAVAAAQIASAQTAFTYQGQLKQSGSPVNANVSMVFRLFSALSGGAQQGPTLTFDGVGGNPAQIAVTNGLFTVSLDFGVGPYTPNAARWLEITVSGQPLTPRQALTPTPFALNTRGVNVDSAGNVGIGTNAPTNALDVRGHLTLEAGGSPGIFTGTGPLELNRFLVLANSLQAPSASGLKAGGVLISDDYFYANPAKTDLVVKGKVGIGVTSLTSKLEIAGQDAITITGFQPVMTMRDSNNSNRRIRFQNVDGNFINFFTEPSLSTGIPPMRIRNDGIDISGQNALVATGFQPLFTLSDSNAGFAQVRMQGVGGEFVFYTQAGINSGIPPMRILNSGITEVRKLQILGGADLAEPFDVCTSRDDEIKPGMVVVIDPDHPGQLMPSSQAYDRKVAGVISGAGGVEAGLSMGHDGTIANGKHPVALTGRVYCMADATTEAIEPGDMLTTANSPGAAMKAADFDRARGATIGKAMTTLKRGERGLVLVLVNPQ